MSFSYHGMGIKLGECGLTILDAKHSHSGTWSCHMGATSVAQTETVKEISVRITGEHRPAKIISFSFYNNVRRHEHLCFIWKM